MKGFPKWFNTRQDVELCLAEMPDEMKAKLTQWQSERMTWLTTRKLADPSQGITDDTHRVTEVDNPGGVTEYYQEEYTEDPGCHLARLGISAEEVQEMIGG